VAVTINMIVGRVVFCEVLHGGLGFGLTEFFLFSGEALSGEIASTRARKPLAGRRLATGREATFAEYCPQRWDSIRKARGAGGAGERAK
jgi:hypothetical protein